MNEKTAKKIRKYSKRAWIEYFEAIRQWPFTTRLHFCWDILIGTRFKRAKQLTKPQVLSQREAPVT